MSKTKVKSNKGKNKNKNKTEVEMDFLLSPDGMRQFFALYAIDEEEIEACVDFFEKFVKQDLPRYLKAQKSLKTYINAAMCVGDDDLLYQRKEVLERIDQFTMDLADFRCRFND